MNPVKWIITYGCRFGLRLVLRIDRSELSKVPREGPLILYSNHTGLIEAPILYTELAPRPKVTALSKIENFQKFFLGFVMRVWKVIPIQRGEADMEAMRACLQSLKEGAILGIAPEGKRSPDGQLQRAQSGVAVLALHSGAPLVPVAHWGGTRMGEHLRRLRREAFVMRVGPVFRLDPKGQRLTREIRQEMADEMMYQLAVLLPESLRGAYADLSKASTKWLRFV
ncbi:MAG TPA: lysophospholipid acyltransferase family protein [Rectinemataceae bacterium]|nr:lysophospholipid acyltransferase family protein [Rectinemataceae bacterium]